MLKTTNLHVNSMSSSLLPEPSRASQMRSPMRSLMMRTPLSGASFCYPVTEKDPLIEIAEKISAIVLTIMAATTNISLFVPFFLIGCAYGIYTESINPSAGNACSPGGGCSQGFLEEITGVRLPKPVSLVANTAITFCHIEHHADVFVPLVGAISGIWIGKQCQKAAAWAEENMDEIRKNLPIINLIFPAVTV